MKIIEQDLTEKDRQGKINPTTIGSHPCGGEWQKDDPAEVAAQLEDRESNRK